MLTGCTSRIYIVIETTAIGKSLEAVLEYPQAGFWFQSAIPGCLITRTATKAVKNEFKKK